MGLKIEVGTERFTGLTTLIQRLESPELQAAARRGLNEHIRLQERQAIRLVAAQTKIPESRVGAISSARLADGGSSMEAAVRFADAALKLGEFTFRSWSRGSIGASAGDWQSKTYPGSFIIGKYGGNIYVRQGKGRFPVIKLWGPVLPNELRRPDQPAFPAAKRFAEQDLEKRVLRNIVSVMGA